MKNSILICFLLLTLNCFSQVPQGISYQAIAYDSDGAIISGGSVAVQISILDNTSTGTLLYQEKHIVMTNTQGLYSFFIGQYGTVIFGTFSTIPWGNGNNKFLKVELDPTGVGTTYLASGTSQLMSVPYALYSQNTNLSNTNAVLNIANIAALRLYSGNTTGDVVYVRGYNTDADGGGGNFIWNSSSTEADNNGTIIKVTSSTKGRWVRSYEGTAINVKWFGILGSTDDSINDYSDRLNQLITYFTNPALTSGIKVVFPRGVYRLINIIIPTGFTIFGEQGSGHNMGYNNSSVTIKPTKKAKKEDVIFRFEPTTKNACLENLHIDGGFNFYTDSLSIKIRAAVEFRRDNEKKICGEGNRLYNNTILNCYQHAVVGSISVSRIESNMMQGLYGRRELKYGKDSDADMGYLGTLHITNSSDNWIVNNEIGGGIEYKKLSSEDSKAVAFFGNQFHNALITGNIFENGDKAGFLMFSTRNRFTNNRYEFSNGNGLELVNNAQSTFTNEYFTANSLSEGTFYDLVIGKQGNAPENNSSTLTFLNPLFLDGNNGGYTGANRPKNNVQNFGPDATSLDWKILFIAPYFSPSYRLDPNPFDITSPYTILPDVRLWP